MSTAASVAVVQPCRRGVTEPEGRTSDATATNAATPTATAVYIPDQVLYCVLQYLRTTELGRVACVSTNFRDAAAVSYVSVSCGQVARP